ncbi:hypothetical protein CWI36_0419p0040 [Hamiltosporidium magnivora]|uniref:Uncharacterized protein n=1 Tax=Hamiltosporidium magnivora TaxID=148818 RepID=A0A4V6MVG5_9MICR|nr:hypothetical protein CWI36_0419p0040 [Hamiltosporidium magnivora]
MTINYILFFFITTIICKEPNNYRSRNIDKDINRNIGRNKRNAPNISEENTIRDYKNDRRNNKDVNRRPTNKHYYEVEPMNKKGKKNETSERDIKNKNKDRDTKDIDRDTRDSKDKQNKDRSSLYIFWILGFVVFFCLITIVIIIKIVVEVNNRNNRSNLELLNKYSIPKEDALLLNEI